MTQLEQLQKMTTIVADTGDIEAIRQFSPQDATTNPSLILKTIQTGRYDTRIKELKGKATDIDSILDELGVLIGHEILQIIPGYVSTEVDARLSFDTKATVDKARLLIEKYESLGWNKSRILIKIASTWEGIQAAKLLEAEGISADRITVTGRENSDPASTRDSEIARAQNRRVTFSVN